MWNVITAGWRFLCETLESLFRIACRRPPGKNWGTARLTQLWQTETIRKRWWCKWGRFEEDLFTASVFVRSGPEELDSWHLKKKKNLQGKWFQQNWAAGLSDSDQKQQVTRQPCLCSQTVFFLGVYFHGGSGASCKSLTSGRLIWRAHSSAGFRRSPSNVVTVVHRGNKPERR